MERFVVIEKTNGKYAVRDMTNGEDCGFSFQSPPLYKSTEWNNYYSARCFAQRLEAMQ